MIEQSREALRKARVERAFNQAVDELDNFIYSYDLPPGLRALKPRLTAKRFEIFKISGKFISSSTTWPHVWSERPTFESRGVVFATKGPKGTDTARHIVFNSTPLRSATMNVRFSPDYAVLGAEERNVTAVGHVVLLFHKGKPIVFVPVLQKITSLSKTKRKLVDKFDNTQGTGRHFAFLALAHKIVEKMRALGVKAELHVPAAEHITTDLSVTSDVKARIQKPFVQLAQYFSPSSIQVGGVKLNTINLSQLKGA